MLIVIVNASMKTLESSTLVCSCPIFLFSYVCVQLCTAESNVSLDALSIYVLCDLWPLVTKGL